MRSVPRANVGMCRGSGRSAVRDSGTVLMPLIACMLSRSRSQMRRQAGFHVRVKLLLTAAAGCCSGWGLPMWPGERSDASARQRPRQRRRGGLRGQRSEPLLGLT